ncbi:MAG: DUF1761 domain-containing protein [Ignavibacteriae bacterium]|nr:DUF1761 domain-containing protein [Ignavibacteriota bacterium]
MMWDTFIEQTNVFAVLTAGGAYFLLGALWYSVLFGNAWSRGLEEHGVDIDEPTGKEAAVKLLITFLGNFFAAFAMSYLVYWTGSYRFASGLALGLVSGLCFSAVGIGISYAWEGKPLKLFLIDSSYHVIGITLTGIILSVWK